MKMPGWRGRFQDHWSKPLLIKSIHIRKFFISCLFQEIKNKNLFTEERYIYIHNIGVLFHNIAYQYDGKYLNKKTYIWRLRPLGNWGSLTCHTYCDTGHPFLRSSPRTRTIHTCCRAFGSGTVTTCYNEFGLSWPGFEHPNFRQRGERQTDCTTAAALPE